MQRILPLPEYLINRLKAGEVVERPFSVVKELVENSLDAWAQNIVVEVKDWGKKLIKVQDDGIWIAPQDLPLTIQRYATSKISSEKDLYSILTYGFRWEALAAIAEVSRFRMVTKEKITEDGEKITEDRWWYQKIGKQMMSEDGDKYHRQWAGRPHTISFVDSDGSNVWYKLEKIWNDVKISPVAVNFNHWTVVYVEDLFYNVPARAKFLKSSKTEEKYIYDWLVSLALANPSVWFKYIKDGKVIFDLKPSSDLFSRIKDIYPSWQKHFKIVENKTWFWHLYGVVSDAKLTFLSPDYIRIFVNKRYIQDKIVKKSILEAYYRQLPHNEYPFAILFLDLNPSFVDVNVHPRKIEVKFEDPGSVYNFVKSSIERVFEDEKISTVDVHKFNFFTKESKNDFNLTSKSWKQVLSLEFENKISVPNEWKSNRDFQIKLWENDLQIIWYLWNTYILLQDKDNFYIVDQHALAERIKFEKLKQQVQQKWFVSHILLQPLTMQIDLLDLEPKIAKLSQFGFDIWLIWKNKIVVYAVPQVFDQYKIDLNLLLTKLLTLPPERINLEKILDEIWASKACKTSIKAWDKISLEEMKNLIEEGFEYIKWQFVCQHWRPSFVRLSKEDIEGLFDRI